MSWPPVRDYSCASYHHLRQKNFFPRTDQEDLHKKTAGYQAISVRCLIYCAFQRYFAAGAAGSAGAAGAARAGAASSAHDAGAGAGAGAAVSAASALPFLQPTTAIDNVTKKSRKE